MKKEELMKIPLKHFGLPNKRKFPMPDEKRLKAAIAYFYTAPEGDREELAKNIIRRYKELGSNIKISKKNSLFKYVPDDMRKIEESSSLFPGSITSFMGILDEGAKLIVEVLIANAKDMIDVDDLDAHLPQDYVHKIGLLGALKTFIIHETMGSEEYSRYPIAYTDFHVSSSSLSSNNGGIMNMEGFSLLNYNDSLNETCSLDPIKETEHIQFCALLREWVQLYETGHRNIVYDRMMIETWRDRVSQLIESHDIGEPDNYAPDTSIQKLRDLGVTMNGEKIDPNVEHFVGSEVKIGEYSIQITDEIKEKYSASGDTSNIYSTSLSIPIVIDTDVFREQNHKWQKGMDVNYDQEKYF